MDAIGIAIALTSSLAFGYALWVSTLVARADFYSKAQKIAQVALVLFFPIVGAVLVHAMYRGHSAPAAKPDRNFVPNRTQDPANAFTSSRYLDGHD